MIEVKTIGTWGFEGAIRGMRMPYESFDKSDSARCCDMRCEECPFKEKKIDCINDSVNPEAFVIGNADMALCKKLIKGGLEHRKFMRMIHVQAEVRAPRYWWAEMDKYKWVEANSSSAMHLITKQELTIDDFSHEGLCADIELNNLIRHLNSGISAYNRDKKSNPPKAESLFIAIKQLLPESYNQLRMIDTNYECLLNIYHQRKAHRLTEWREFCKWVESLPYMKEFIS